MWCFFGTSRDESEVRPQRLAPTSVLPATTSSATPKRRRDPNFNLTRDDARVAMGDNMPASYLAQERPDPVVRGYLDSRSE